MKCFTSLLFIFAVIHHSISLIIRYEETEDITWTRLSSYQKESNSILSKADTELNGSLDPEINMNATELISSKGMPVEEHYVTTEDGYILGMQRIPRPNTSHRLPVLIMHGLLSSSDGFLLNLRNESLAYILYDRGFDVWLGNVRGNKYSRQHTHLDPDKDNKFWEWSFDEMGKFDVPAMVTYVLKKTGYDKLNYIGHSQGTVVLFSSVMMHGPKFSDKIDKFFALAPAAYVPDMTSPLRYLTKMAKMLRNLDVLIKHGEFLPSEKESNFLEQLFCRDLSSLCQVFSFAIFGHDSKHTNESRVPIYDSHDPSGTSAQNMMHWEQMVQQEGIGLTYYDYGRAFINILHYGQPTPPKYDFSKFTTPTYVFCGVNDALVNLQDCRALTTLIPNLKQLLVIDDYSHIDFLYAMNAPSAVYQSISRFMNGDV